MIRELIGWATMPLRLGWAVASGVGTGWAFAQYATHGDDTVLIFAPGDPRHPYQIAQSQHREREAVTA